MAKQAFTASYTNLELYLKHLAFEPNTRYTLSLDTLGGEMELFFNGQIIENGVKYIPSTEVWTNIRFTFTTGKDVSNLTKWGICFVKTAWPWHAFGGTYCSTYVDNVQLFNTLTGEELLLGGDFEEDITSPVYDSNWRPSILDNGKALGVALVEDPLCASNHCLRFPETINPVSYPKPLPLQAHCFGRFCDMEQDLQCIEFYGRPQHRFLIAEHGNITVKIGDSDFTIPTGCAICLPPHTAYRYTYHAGENTMYYWLAVSGEDVNTLLESLGLTEPHLLKFANITSLTVFIDRLLQLSSKAVTYPYAVSGQLHLFLSELEHQLAPKVTDSKHRTLIESVAQRIFTYPETTVGNAELAAECGLSENYFITLFKQLIGTSPHQYRLQALVRKSQHLLLETSQTIQEVAYSLGFDDPLYFSRLFKSIQGISPYQYRNNYK